MDVIGLMIVAIVCIPVVLIIWSSKKKGIGTIRCKRCNHVGPAKGMWVPFGGIKPVCQKCGSDDWVTVDTSSCQGKKANTDA